ncbi:MAG TPA: restriction endonuclease subunit S [Prolixibacteraceae bacterium]|nr:restriction endonuclease subunit S [Prolixibacteraceae bacterium]
MKKVKISDVCEVIAGQSPPSSTYNTTGMGIPFFQGKTDFGYLYPTVKNWCNAPQKIALPNDILISVRAPVGPTNINYEKSCIGRGLSAIRCSEKIDTKFLLYYLRSIETKIAENANGSTFSAITQKDLLKIQIPLIPLSTQKKISAILDAADVYRQKTKTLIEKYDQLAQSLFLDMFGDPVTNEKGWEKTATINYCSCIVPGRDKPKSFTGDIPWVTTGDLNHLGFTEKSISNIALSKSEIAVVKAKIIPKGSVIMTCVGDLGIISINSNPIVINQQLHAFLCSERINNLFLMYNLSHQTFYMHRMASSTTVPYMNKTIANNTPTIVPPITLQNQFAERIQLIDQQKQQAQASLQKAEDLFNSLLQKAFKGELVM